MQKKIYYHHTDSGGVVYYAKYLEFLEEARTELLAQKGVKIDKLAKEGILFVVYRQEIDYKFPSFLADNLEIVARITDVSKVSIEFVYEIRNQNHQAVVQARTIVVCVDKNFKPKSIPEEIRKKIS
jgi:acyl-CoA thioester hydrolase